MTQDNERRDGDGATGDVTNRLHALEGKLDDVLSTLKGKHKPFYTVEEIAETVGRSTDTVRRWIREGKLVADRVAGTGPRGRLLIRRESLMPLVGRGLGGCVNSADLG